MTEESYRDFVALVKEHSTGARMITMTLYVNNIDEETTGEFYYNFEPVIYKNFRKKTYKSFKFEIEER